MALRTTPKYKFDADRSDPRRGRLHPCPRSVPCCGVTPGQRYTLPGWRLELTNVLLPSGAASVICDSDRRLPHEHLTSWFARVAPPVAIRVNRSSCAGGVAD